MLLLQAPELLLGQRCTMKADIFSLGVRSVKCSHLLSCKCTLMASEDALRGMQVTLWEIVTQAVPVRGQLR